MVEVILQWFYILLASSGLVGDLQADPSINWRGSTQAPPAAVDISTEHHRKFDNSLDGDIYNGF